MKRITLAVLLVLVLTLTLATAVFAGEPPDIKGAPDAIYIDPNADSHEDLPIIIRDGTNDGPPAVWLKHAGTWIYLNPNAGAK